MKRRDFIGKICKICIIATVVPVTVLATKETGQGILAQIENANTYQELTQEAVQGFVNDLMISKVEELV